MSAEMPPVFVSGAFDDLGVRDVRFLEEARKLGRVHVLLWTDDAMRAATGRLPKFPDVERLYLLRALRFVDQVTLVNRSQDPIPSEWIGKGSICAIRETEANEEKMEFFRAQGLECQILSQAQMEGVSSDTEVRSTKPIGRKKVIVTGCYDWLHSGHVRFFEEVSGYGDLYVVVGHDVNIRLLKGAGHPLVSEQERRYMVGSIRFVKEALISTGEGWLDAEPEIARIKPDIYAVNEDGDKGGKRDFCEQHGIEYLVLKRIPAEGLRPRSSTELRGF
jgi:cytidyltransferase-like protein